MTAPRADDPRRDGGPDPGKRLELRGGRVVHVDLELRLAAGASRRDCLARPGYVDALAIAYRRRLVERDQISFLRRTPRGGQGVGDARARRKPVHAGVRNGARDVHDDQRLGRPGGRRGVLDDHDRLTVASVQARQRESDDGDRRDREQDEDRSAHVRRVSGASRRA